MEATIKRVDNGYVVTLRFSSALAEQVYIFKDLKGAYEKIDGFFLEGLTEGKLGMENLLYVPNGEEKI